MKDYIKQLKKGKKTPETLLYLIEETHFFFKKIKEKFESQDPETIKEARAELQAFSSRVEKGVGG